MSTLKFCSCHISSYKYRIFKILVSTPHNYPLIMGGRDKNFEDLMLSARDMTWAIFQKQYFICFTTNEMRFRDYETNWSWIGIHDTLKCSQNVHLFPFVYSASENVQSNDKIWKENWVMLTTIRIRLTDWKPTHSKLMCNCLKVQEIK
jgi:hypothetical protein